MSPILFLAFNEPLVNLFYVFFISAGVGRTGVFIAVETACCLIEAGVPVYPEQMLDTLRDQRPSLIQTPVRVSLLLRDDVQFMIFPVSMEPLL